MDRDQKTALVEELSEQIRSAEAIFAVDYRGISVSEAAELRGRLRDAGTRFRIVKNSLTERATDAAGVDALKAVLEGPTALAFVSGDVLIAAKALSDVGRTLGTLSFKGGMMNGNALTAEQIQSIARLPARDVLHGQLVGTIAAPLSQLVRTLNALIAGVAVQLQQVADQGLVGADAAPTSEAATASDTDESAEASTRAASDADVSPPSAELEEPETSEEPATEARGAEASEEPEAPGAEASVGSEAPGAEASEGSEAPDADASEE
jgi:large subunit ribosomal protein L10